MKKIPLGASVMDAVTGFEGVVTSRTEYLHGPRRYCVEGKAKPGERPPTEYLDEKRLLVADADQANNGEESGS